MRYQVKICCIKGCDAVTRRTPISMMKDGWESITWKRSHGIFLCPKHANDKNAIKRAKFLSEEMYKAEEMDK